jgi:hypothetical protein
MPNLRAVINENKTRNKLDINRDKTPTYKLLERRAKRMKLDVDSVPVRCMLWRQSDSQDAKAKREITFLKRYINRHKLFKCGTDYSDSVWYFNSYCCEPKSGFDYKSLCLAHPEFKSSVCGKTMYLIPPNVLGALMGSYAPSETLPDGTVQLCEATLFPHIFCFELKDSSIRESVE